MNIWYYANPERFAGLARTLLPWTMGLALVLAAVATVWGLVIAPPDYQQGDAMRIIYVHVPAAWMAMFVYAVMAVSSAVAFIWNHPLADVAAKASAPIGAVFTALALVTGMLWGE
ncbi:MAG: cytochrome c biogenesis protein CcsA, partial [Alphaproteobacteria bacterium]